MTAHSFWKFGDLVATSGGFFAIAEMYLRQSIGGADEIPTSTGAFSSFGAPYTPDKACDLNPATLYSANGSGPSEYIAFGYASPINAVEIYMQARADVVNTNIQSGNLYYSDTSITGPWTLFAPFSVSPWTTTGQIQTYDFPTDEVLVAAQSAFVPLLPITDNVKVSAQSAFVPMLAQSVKVASQAAFVAMLAPAVKVTAQSAFLPMFPGAPVPRRRQYYLQ